MFLLVSFGELEIAMPALRLQFSTRLMTERRDNGSKDVNAQLLWAAGDNGGPSSLVYIF